MEGPTLAKIAPTMTRPIRIAAAGSVIRSAGTFLSCYLAL